MHTVRGGPASSDFGFYDAPLDANQAYSFHTYNLFSDAIDKSPLEELAGMAPMTSSLRTGRFSRS
ncbi:MAG: hypothetical protein GY719_40970 [bacterium]|nr:hypothetical protein [bacterium]